MAENQTHPKNGGTSDSKSDCIAVDDPELDISSPTFNPLKALYTPNFKVTNKVPKVQYQNFAALESTFHKVGLLNLNKQVNVAARNTAKNKTSTTQDQSLDDAFAQRNELLAAKILPESGGSQAVVRGSKHLRNIFTHMQSIRGPLERLNRCAAEKQRIRVTVRCQKRVRGVIEGILLYFDKHWNLVLKDVSEQWKMRKSKYANNKSIGEPKDCTDLLNKLGIELPQREWKSLNRKNVEIKRQLQQLFVRGEQVVLITLISNKTVDTDGAMA